MSEEFKNMTPEEQDKFVNELKTKGPRLKEVFDSLNAARLQQVMDPITTYQRVVPQYTPDMFLPYISTSPTARKYLQALENYAHGYRVLRQFGKHTIENEEDCELLKSAFHAYSWGHMVDSVMYGYFQPPPYTPSLLQEFIDRRPNDIFAQHFKICMLFHKRDQKMSKYESLKEKIIEAELLADRIRHLVEIKEERMVLIDLYYLLGSLYRITEQVDRALDSFQKCLDLDTSNIDAMYAVGIQKIEQDLEGAIKLLHRYLDSAPKCDTKYPNALYQLGICYFLHFKNTEEALKYYKLGLKAEDQRLPFIDKDHANIPEKRLLETMSNIFTSTEDKAKTSMT